MAELEVHKQEIVTSENSVADTNQSYGNAVGKHRKQFFQEVKEDNSLRKKEGQEIEDHQGLNDYLEIRSETAVSRSSGFENLTKDVIRFVNHANSQSDRQVARGYRERAIKACALYCAANPNSPHLEQARQIALGLKKLDVRYYAAMSPPKEGERNYAIELNHDRDGPEVILSDHKGLSKKVFEQIRSWERANPAASLEERVEANHTITHTIMGEYNQIVSEKLAEIEPLQLREALLQAEQGLIETTAYKLANKIYTPSMTILSQEEYIEKYTNPAIRAYLKTKGIDIPSDQDPLDYNQQALEFYKEDKAKFEKLERELTQIGKDLADLWKSMPRPLAEVNQEDSVEMNLDLLEEGESMCRHYSPLSYVTLRDLDVKTYIVTGSFQQGTDPAIGHMFLYLPETNQIYETTGEGVQLFDLENPELTPDGLKVTVEGTDMHYNFNRVVGFDAVNVHYAEPLDRYSVYYFGCDSPDQSGDNAHLVQEVRDWVLNGISAEIDSTDYYKAQSQTNTVSE